MRNRKRSEDSFYESLANGMEYNLTNVCKTDKNFIAFSCLLDFKSSSIYIVLLLIVLFPEDIT